MALSNSHGVHRCEDFLMHSCSCSRIGHALDSMKIRESTRVLLALGEKRLMSWCGHWSFSLTHLFIPCSQRGKLSSNFSLNSARLITLASKWGWDIIPGMIMDILPATNFNFCHIFRVLLTFHACKPGNWACSQLRSSRCICFSLPPRTATTVTLSLFKRVRLCHQCPDLSSLKLDRMTRRTRSSCLHITQQGRKRVREKESTNARIVFGNVVSFSQDLTKSSRQC